MAVSIDTKIKDYYTWGSYPYETWNGDSVKKWGTSYNTEVTLVDSEDVRLAERCRTSSRYFRNAFETYGISETGFEKKLNKASNETVLFKEYTDKAYIANKNEQINIDELFDRDISYLRSINENIKATELYYGNYSYTTEEFYYIQDSYANEVELIKETPIALDESLTRKSTSRRLYDESITLAEKPINGIKRPVYEDCMIKDTYLKSCCEGVYSNLFITEGEFSDQDFADAINIAPGYTQFVDFKVGEYDYQEALVRITIESNAQAQPTAQGIVMHVDIPDTDDRGTAEIVFTNAPTEIGFNKHYYTVPEVQVTLRGANTLSGAVTPNIVEITTTHFTVELLTSGGTRTKGSISWASKGY